MSIDAIRQHLCCSIDTLYDLSAKPDSIIQAANLIIKTLKSGNKIMLCGNGGSAADAQHIAAELMGRYKVNRKPLSAIALTTDTSALTAIGNDFGFEQVFSRQVYGLGKENDCLIAISTSGVSPNILEAMRAAISIGMSVIGLTGAVRSPKLVFELMCNVCINIPSSDTPIIQQMHITIGHIICGLVEEIFRESTSFLD